MIRAAYRQNIDVHLIALSQEPEWLPFELRSVSIDPTAPANDRTPLYSALRLLSIEEQERALHFCAKTWERSQAELDGDQSTKSYWTKAKILVLLEALTSLHWFLQWVIASSAKTEKFVWLQKLIMVLLQCRVQEFRRPICRRAFR